MVDHRSLYLQENQRISLLPLYRRPELFTCPFCGHSSHYLWQLGHNDKVLTDNKVAGGGKRYAKCMSCGSTDRDRLVYLYLRGHTDIFKKKDARVLHIAPERCLRKVLKKQFESTYTAADKFTKGYWYARDTVKMDITAISYPAATFDLIVCNHVLEHIEDDQKAISELARVLMPGGIAILQVPISLTNAETIENKAAISAEERKKAYGQFDHVRLYGQDYSARLALGGFTVSEEHIAHLYPQAALNPCEVVFVGSK